jgi:osmoprotectant transport system permease protein
MSEWITYFREELSLCLEDLPAFLGGHMLLSLAALAVGLVISLPLGIAASRRPKLAELTLGLAGVVQTVPSLALLALMVPLLGGKIGFRPAFIALTLYSFLPILANTVIGIRGVDPALTEAARGLGMSDGQMLMRVQLPLAAPVIIAGIRTATVLVVGTATLATPVGWPTLGSYIFSGLEMRNNFVTVFGCVAAALLAVAMDQLVRLLQLASQRRSRVLAGAGAAGLLLLVVGGLSAPIARLVNPPPNPAIVGHGPFTEQYILAEVLKEQLEPRFQVEQRRFGETILFKSLCNSEIDCCVDYSGNIWTLEMKQKPADRETVLKGVTRYLKQRYGVECLGSLGFENAYALAMPRDRAAALGIKSLHDLKGHSEFKVGGDNMIFRRDEWRNLCDLYGLQFRDKIPMDSTFMYGAVVDRQVDVITAYTTDGRIDSNNLIVLDQAEDRRAFPPYDAVLLVSPKAAARPGFIEALRPLVKSIDEKKMRESNGGVDVDRRRPRQVGRELSAWLRSRAGRSEIHEIKTMSQIVPQIDDSTLLVFDLDNTLIEPVGNLGSDQWYYYLIRRYRDIDGLTEKQATSKADDLWNKVQWIVKVKPVEANTPEIIKQLQGRGVVMMGLTARTPDIADRTLDQLAFVGMVLDRTTVHDKDLELKADDVALYTRGVLFVGEHNDKGKVLAQFLRQTDRVPKKVVFVDDKPKHVTNVEKALRELNVGYTGLRYGMADAKVKEFEADTEDIQLFADGVFTEKAAAAVKEAQKK